MYEMENEQKEIKKQASKRQRRANTLNPMKTGKYSKKIPANAIKYLNNPEEFKKLLERTIKSLESADLDPKTKIFYLNTLNNTFKTIFGNRNFNVNLDVSPDSANKMYEVWTTTQKTQENKGEQKDDDGTEQSNRRADNEESSRD